LNHKAFQCQQRSNPQDHNRLEQGKQQQRQHHVAACQVVEEECEDEWNERTVNIPGIGNVPMIAAMSGDRTEKKHIFSMRNKHTSFGEVNGEALNVTCEEFKQMQREDVNLSKYWKIAEEQKDDGAKTKFAVQDEILYRIHKAAPDMDPVEQVCVQ